MDDWILEGLQIQIDKEEVFKMIDCYEDSPVYEEVAEEYDEILEDMRALLKPIGIIGLGEITENIATEKYPAGTRTIFAVLSVGNEIKEESTKYFHEGDYVRGMLIDAIADTALFSLDDAMMDTLQKFCRKHKVGIRKRLEAPHDISMEAQKVAWERLQLKERFHIDISEGFMYDPVKTSCQIFVLSDDKEEFRAKHDCRSCNNFTCKHRRVQPVQITVHKGMEVGSFELPPMISLMEGLRKEGYQFAAACGGKGLCGKCRVRVMNEGTYITAEDKSVFTEEELNDGWRLACRVYPSDDLEIEFSLDDETEFEVLTGTLSEEDYGEEGNAGKITAVRENGYEVAVDIGTTTIAMELIGKDSHKVLGKAAFINSQRAYGADVISRIQASTEGRKEELQKCIRDDLEKGLKQLVKENELALTEIKNIVISGNTTMIHLLMGYDCSSLGVYPFTPVNIGLIRGNAEEILGMKEMDTEVQILPGISAYVGGDIVSGLFACDFDRKEEVCMLIDLGTNGEMAIGNKDRILVTSTAAGPAFEGGNITWGTGSIPGAICTVHIEENKAEVGTIKNAPPVGICGTGVVETAAELLKEELIDETGRLEDEYFDEGYPLAETKDNRMILFTQKDMREIQLAKAAIRAGAETLACRYGINKTEISKVYVAGGFGYKLDTDKAIAIGMFPEEFEGHIEAVGNSSLGGAGKYLCEADVEERVSSLVKVSEEIALSTDKVFNDFYMDAMFFE